MVNRSTLGKTQIIFASLLAIALQSCDDGKTATEQLDPWVDKTVSLAPQGPREGDHALTFTTNLEFVVVKKLAEPRTVCNSSSRDGSTERVTTEVPDENCVPTPDGSARCEVTDTPKTQEIETEVQVPGETQTICAPENTIDAPRVSRVTAVVRPSKPGSQLDPGSVYEVVLGFHAKQALKEMLVDDEERPPSFEKLHIDDDLLVSLKASGYKLTSLRVRLGDGTRFRPGDEITIEALVDPVLGSSLSTLGTNAPLPEFKTEEQAGS
jgi:hypothetical protein